MNTDSSTILDLMKTTYGRMHGLLSFRPFNVSTWSSGYCAINVASGSLIYQAKGEPALAKTLIPDLRGCRVRSLYDSENEWNYLSVSTASSGLRIHLRPPVPETFDSWLAALLCWQPIRPKGIQNKKTKPQSISIIERRATDKRQASEVSASRNSAIIKVGKMLLWEGSTDTDASHPVTPRRISTYKQLRAISRSWQRVSCTLLENGHFKLLTESDAQLISAIRLSSLSRCAIQQLHPSVLEDEYCLAVYPQYLAQPNEEIQSRPIYLSLESRVLFEVWFVLLRAFTIPELYGPEQPIAEATSVPRERLQNSSSNLCQGLFRVERSLSVRITEAKLASPVAHGEPRVQTQGQAGFLGGVKGEFYAEILLDGEPRGRTSAKPHTSMFWMEDFVFGDLPPVLSSALVLLKVRNPDEKEWTTVARGPYDLSHGDSSQITVDGDIQVSSHDTVFGKVELQLDDMEQGVEIQQRWPILDSADTPAGHALMKLRLTERVVLMKEDYTPLLDLLRRFSNRLTVTVARAIPAELKSVSKIFLDIFQVCGNASEWIMTLVEDEIDGVHHEASRHRLTYGRRLNPHDSYESAEDRELMIRDLGRAAALEANLLFRGNTLLTRALDAHMRRLGKEYLDETIGERLRDIDESDPDCEVDPSKVGTTQDLDRNWGNLITLTIDLWAAIACSATRCPTELKQLFRHIKSCAETRYGDFCRTVAYSSVSGFLFLRFFCPAILNPKLFGLLKGGSAGQFLMHLTVH
jgi:GTPase-activator protein for Ras-like GTPase